jgi:hypothetical protein
VTNGSFVGTTKIRRQVLDQGRARAVLRIVAEAGKQLVVLKIAGGRGRERDYVTLFGRTITLDMRGP